MTTTCDRCNMAWGEPHNCYPPAQLLAAEAELAAYRTVVEAARVFYDAYVSGTGIEVDATRTRLWAALNALDAARLATPKAVS